MLFCEGILLEPFETGVCSREPSPSVHRGQCVCLCVTRLLFQIRNFKAQKRWEYPGPHLYHIPAFSHSSKSQPPTLPLLTSLSISAPLLALPSLPAWPSQCLRPVYGYSVSAGDRVQACFWRLRSSLEDSTLAAGQLQSLCKREGEGSECVCGDYITDKLYYVRYHASLKMWQLLQCD